MWKSYNTSHQWLIFSSSYSGASLLNETTEPSKQLNPASFYSGAVTKNINFSTTTISPVNCISPSINEFPSDFFTDEQRLAGCILVHAIIVAYVCAMMAIVCDRYFVPSLKVICKHFNVPPDVAGATFMAVGASSPELFSSVIGAFVAKGDIGVGTVVGSAVFNILCVTGASGLALRTMVAQLDWYPITRDCFVYVITVASLVIVIQDNLVTWLEASCLLLMFVCYVTLLYFNENLRNITVKTVGKVHVWWRRRYDHSFHNVYKSITVSENTPLTVTIEGLKKDSYNTYEKDSACPSSENASVFTDSSCSETFNCKTNCSKTIHSITECELLDKSLDERASLSDEFTGSLEEFSLLRAPESLLKKIIWVVLWPANALFSITIPNCSTEKNLKWFPMTFLSSILWLGVLSYVSFWMVAYIGYTFGIPDTVSGLTILAAGTSVPELVASIIVVKAGMANMAVSNLIGSNIFDILFCLGLPWLVKASLNTQTYSLVINSSALTYTTLILLSNVVLFYISLFICGWKLNARVGILALCLYAVFLVLASLYESNVFGDFNPPTCLPTA